MKSISAGSDHTIELGNVEMSDDTPNEGQSTEDGQLTISFDYLKSSLFRTVHVDGAWGGLTPKGHINMVLYVDRPPIPKRTVHTFTDERDLIEDLSKRNVRDADVVRELEVSCIMTVEVAKSLRNWLIERIHQLETIRRATSNKVKNAETESANSIEGRAEPQ